MASERRRRWTSVLKAGSVLAVIALSISVVVVSFSSAIVMADVSRQLARAADLDGATVLAGDPSEFVNSDTYSVKFSISSHAVKSLLSSSRVFANCQTVSRVCGRTKWTKSDGIFDDKRPNTTVCATTSEPFDMRDLCIDPSNGVLWYDYVHLGW